MSLASLAASLASLLLPLPQILGFLFDLHRPQPPAQPRQQPRRGTQRLQACSFISRGKRCHFPPLPFVLLQFCFCSSGLLNSAPISFRDCFGKFSCLFSVACFGILRLGMVCQQGCPTRFCLFRPEGFREAKKCAVNFR